MSSSLVAAERTQNFDQDPAWDGFNNRVTAKPREVKQDFGYARSTNCQSQPGEIGGYIQPTAELAYYAKKIPPKTFQDKLSARGRLVCKDRQFNLLIAFFNSDTVNEWRTPNTIALRIYGRGDVFYVYGEYATRKWRAGAVQFETNIAGRAYSGFPSGPGVVHEWTLAYDPEANNGAGAVKATMDKESVTVNLEPGHKTDGATFNRFGLLNIMKHYDGAGEVWIDDLTLNGETESFDKDPQWEGLNNRGSFTTRDVRAWFDFGYTNTHFAGGKRAGELGGRMCRGDGRHTNLLAYYGDRLAVMDLSRPLRASGKVSIHRGVSDSDTLLGFFHAEHSIGGGSDDLALPPDFLGIRIGGPSREGFFFSPCYRIHESEHRTKDPAAYIYPDGTSHDWTLAYEPNANGAGGKITATLGQEKHVLELSARDKAMGAHFNRFGIITTHTDGSGQKVYFDDLTYTASQSD